MDDSMIGVAIAAAAVVGGTIFWALSRGGGKREVSTRIDMHDARNECGL